MAERSRGEMEELLGAGQDGDQCGGLFVDEWMGWWTSGIMEFSKAIDIDQKDGQVTYIGATNDELFSLILRCSSITCCRQILYNNAMTFHGVVL